MKLRTLFVVLTLITAMVVSACSGNSGKSGDASSQPPAAGEATPSNAANGSNDEAIELQFVNWATAEEATKEKFNKVIAAFEAENPNIKIKSVTVPFSEIQNQLTVMTTAGNAPDIAQVEASVGVSLAAMGALEPVDEWISPTFIQDLNKSYYDVGLYEDNHYLVPWGGGTNGFWYNKKILKDAGLDPENPPKTMEELEHALAQIVKLDDIVGIQYDTSPRAFSTLFQWPFMKTLSDEPFNREASKVNEMTEYAEWLRNLIKKGYTLPGKKLGEFRPLGAQNRLAFAIDAPFYKGMVQSLDESITDEMFYETWGVTAIPAGADGKSYTVGGSDHYTAVFKASKHKAEAAKFLEFIADNDTSLTEYIIPMGYLPVTDSALQRFPDQFNNPIITSFMSDIVPTSIAPPYGESFTNAATILGTNLQEVIISDRPIADILSKTHDKVEGVISGK